jgi:hypothetical protein
MTAEQIAAYLKARGTKVTTADVRCARANGHLRFELVRLVEGSGRSTHISTLEDVFDWLTGGMLVGESSAKGPPKTPVASALDLEECRMPLQRRAIAEQLLGLRRELQASREATHKLQTELGESKVKAMRLEAQVDQLTDELDGRVRRLEAERRR